jgi:hypothetical protein
MEQVHPATRLQEILTRHSLIDRVAEIREMEGNRVGVRLHPRLSSDQVSETLDLIEEIIEVLA